MSQESLTHGRDARRRRNLGAAVRPLLAVCVSIGGFVAIAVVTRVVPCELPVSLGVAFFRSLGRSYGIAGGSVLGVAPLTGGGLLSRRGWDG